MPILLDDAVQIQNIKSYTPKWFDNKLTGSGKKQGILSEPNNPIHNKPFTSNVDTHLIEKMIKQKVTNGRVTVTYIPVGTLHLTSRYVIDDIPIPELTDMAKIGYHPVTKNELYVKSYLEMIILEDIDTIDTDPTAKVQHFYHFVYTLRFFGLDGKDPNPVTSASRATRVYNDEMKFLKENMQGHQFAEELTVKPVEKMKDIMSDILVPYGWNIDQNAVNQWLQDIDVFDLTTIRSEQWQTTIDKDFALLCDNVVAKNKKMNTTTYNDYVDEQIRYMETYNIPLDLYKNIYQTVQMQFSPDDAKYLCKQNLNLLLSDTMNNLEKNKANLQQIPASVGTLASTTQQKYPFSNDQMTAITATASLMLIQAGAGTGKSTVVLARIAQMIAAGIDPKRILVLSFTNAAADHIRDLNPGIKSLTTARMIHTIYEANFPDQELSTLETIMNSLDIYYFNHQLAYDFQMYLRAVNRNEKNAFTMLNNFVEKNFDEIIKMLNMMKQTSLELEIVICYQMIGKNLLIPPQIEADYLIVDEVQDNSIFEFIYLLKYTDYYKNSLCLVGDCSQTLYEFRASNPKALNILEGSGVFATYQLTTNYRSNQEILDFANVALQRIEANQYANIQLHSNVLSQVTEQSFLDKVNFNYKRLNKIGDFNKALPGWFTYDLNQYILDCFAKNEKVAFLSFTRRDVKNIKSILEKKYPAKNIVSLVPDKQYNTTVFSQFIRKYWDDTKFAPAANITYVIQHEIMNRLDYLVRGDVTKTKPVIQNLITKWRTEQSANIASWYHQLCNGIISKDTYLDNIKESLLQHEIKNNAIKQALLQIQNQQQKDSEQVKNADFILSTIHSAKGLEFDNVVVIYRNENKIEEDKKRMYYVAFTRAMKTEYILAYDVTASPQIEADYLTILRHLHTKYPALNSPVAAMDESDKRNRVLVKNVLANGVSATLKGSDNDADTTAQSADSGVDDDTES